MIIEIQDEDRCHDCRFINWDNCECILHKGRLLVVIVGSYRSARKCQQCLNKEKVEVVYE